MTLPRSTAPTDHPQASSAIAVGNDTADGTGPAALEAAGPAALEGAGPAQRLERLALGISYHGSAYQGWQSQRSGLTVQDKIETALGLFCGLPAGQRVTIHCAGRTDAGVHALMQVVHFDSAVVRDMSSWVRGTNSYLPSDIAVQWAHTVPAQFHSRGSAVARRYVYVLLQSPVRPSLEASRVGWIHQDLALEPMQAAANALLGEHDFSTFRAAQCQALSPVKTIHQIAITQRGAYWRFEFEANAFLHHMIRNIMGCLVAVGQGKYPAAWLGELLEARSRAAAAPTFSPDGLYFAGPVYAPHWGLPARTPAYDWLP